MEANMSDRAGVRSLFLLGRKWENRTHQAQFAGNMQLFVPGRGKSTKEQLNQGNKVSAHSLPQHTIATHNCEITLHCHDIEIG